MTSRSSSVVGFLGGAVAASVFWAALRPSSHQMQPGEEARAGDAALAATARPPPERVARAERALLDDPTLPASSRAAVHALREETRRLRREVERLRGGAEAPPPSRSFNPKTTGFTHEELLEMAERCEVRWDMPSLPSEGPLQLTARDASRLGLGEQQILAANEVLRENDTFIRRRIRALYVEATGDPEGAASLSPQSMIEEISDKSRGEDIRIAYQRIARARAGLADPAADASGTPVFERLYRLLTSAGDRVETLLADRLGPEVAARWRAAGDGLMKSVSGLGCPE